jgi:hypothetical protein
LVASLSGILAPRAVFAGDLRVDASACAGLDGARLRALLQVEVQPVLEANPGMPDLEVGVTCSERELLMVVRDPVTNKQLQRAMPAPAPTDPERERIVALAASQLFRASWLELTTPAEPEAEEIGAPTGDAPEQRAAEQVVETRAVTSLGNHELSFHPSIRWRDLAAPLLMNHGGIRYGYRLPKRFLAWGEAGAGFGRASRRLGFVNVVDVFGLLGFGWRTKRFGPATFDIDLGGGVVYQRLRGRGASAQVDEGVLWAVTGEALGRFGLSFHARRLVTSIAAEGGFMFEGPSGAVGDEPVVDPDGAWLGVGLRIGAVLPNRRN